MSRVMTGAQMVLEALADQGVEHIFGYPGGAVLPIYDALRHGLLWKGQWNKSCSTS